MSHTDDQRRHGFELMATELRVYTNGKLVSYHITPHQILLLMWQASQIIYKLFDLVPR